MKRKKCVDYISRFVLFCLCLVCVLVFATPKWKMQSVEWGVLWGWGWAGNPYDFCIKLWILTRLYIWTLGCGEQSEHCQDSIGTSTRETQLLLPTLHIFLFKRENSEKMQKLELFAIL